MRKKQMNKTEKYYLLIIHKHSGSQLVTNTENKILLYFQLENAKKKAQEILDSKVYKTCRIDIVPSEFNIEEDVHFEILYKIEG